MVVSYGLLQYQKNQSGWWFHGGYTQTSFWHIALTVAAYQDIYVPVPVCWSFHLWK